MTNDDKAAGSDVFSDTGPKHQILEVNGIKHIVRKPEHQELLQK